MSFLDNETIHIISMIVCIIGAISFIFTETESIISEKSLSGIFGAMVLILIGFVPIINIMVAITIVLFFIILLLAHIFKRLKNE